MNTLHLSGLSGSTPLGAMAAFGLLRILAREKPFGDVWLSWSHTGDWIPRLHCQQSFSLDQLTEFFIDRQSERIRNVFPEAWCDDIKSAPEDFRRLGKSVYECFHDDTDLSQATELAAFLSAYGSEVIRDKKAKPEVKPTAFHMTAGQQRFLKSAKDIADSLDPNQLASKRQKSNARRKELRETYHSALVGPWMYQDSFHSLGWDPATEGLYALSASSPSESGARSVRAAVWLAFESLPLFPSVPVGSRLHTTGFDRSGMALSWPIWEPPISLDTLRILLGSAELQDSAENIVALRARGVRAILRSQSVRDANGRGTFRNAIETSVT